MCDSPEFEGRGLESQWHRGGLRGNLTGTYGAVGYADASKSVARGGKHLQRTRYVSKRMKDRFSTCMMRWLFIGE